jgi:hypothetical protein
MFDPPAHPRLILIQNPISKIKHPTSIKPGPKARLLVFE